MRIPRIFLDVPLQQDSLVVLDENAARHVIQVLRLKKGAPLILFNGKGGEFEAVLDDVSRGHVAVITGKFINRDVESKLEIILAQGVSRGERMDYTLQKAVELGVTRVIPLITQHTVVNLKGDRRDRRVQHWQQIVNSACEQCGRSRVPKVEDLQEINLWLPASGPGMKFILHHSAMEGISKFNEQNPPITLLVGPEGGFSDQELAAAQQAGFIPLQLGPRILRTETAALVALSVLQAKWGDLA